MTILETKLHVKQEDTVYDCNIYTTEAEATPIGGSTLQITKDGETGYLGLWPKSVSGGEYHSPLTCKKDGVEYWVETEVQQNSGLRFKIGDATTADLMTIPTGVTAIRCWLGDHNDNVTSVYRDGPVTPGKTYYFAGSMEVQQHYFSVYLIDASDDTSVGQVAMIPGPNEGNNIAPAYVIVEYLMQIGDAVTVSTMNGDQFTDFSITIPSNINVVKLLLTRAQVAAQGGVDCMNRESPYTIWGEVTGTNGNYEFYVGVTPNKTYDLRLNIHISNGGGSCSVYYSDSINAQTPDVTDY